MMQIRTVTALAKKAKEFRKIQGLTQVDVAGLAHVSMKFIIDFERGKPTCQIGKVLDVCQAIGLRIEARV